MKYLGSKEKISNTRDNLTVAIELTQILATHLEQNESTSSLASEWNTLKNDNRLETNFVDTNYKQVVSDIMPVKKTINDFKSALQQIKGADSEVAEEKEEQTTQPKIR